MPASTRPFLPTLLLLLSACSPGARADVESTPSARVTVYKSPTCVCCAEWVRHIEAEGFAADVVSVPDLTEKKAELGVPSLLSSCHTSTIGPYVLEGHVPAEAIRKLMRERPDARGLLLPGMPSGSPGMPGPESSYSVLLLGADGQVGVYLEN